MSVGEHPVRWWDWCMPENENKKIEPLFIEGTEPFFTEPFFKVPDIISTKINLINF